MKPSRSPALEVDVWRGDAAGGELQRFDVPRQASQTVLDVVTWIQRHADPSLAYRFACRVGMCGSCAMTVNGKPRWTCRTHVGKAGGAGGLVIEPLRNLPVIRDLACDMSEFFARWQRAEGRFAGGRGRAEAVARVLPDNPSRRAASAGIECINCAICYAACDVVAWNADYLGPAALNRAWTLQNDERDRRHDERLAAVSADGGCFNCHSQQGCSEFCPNGLDPTAAIAGLKRQAAAAFLRRKYRQGRA